ncbi:hypothetical protein PPEP_a2776 [Pseudoalteromonas peptidolytica F12-50-A1]|uniref:Uncharacterized protein n=1 Tax=Pseudoalteromonas peptidolytica F12-50-A1 TaxID=1315280 RepID=A0A8I0MX12_9GAMM|nr:hypothetical protein [Pseudoalteromonas peptidolytica F12-50-A1]
MLFTGVYLVDSTALCLTKDGYISLSSAAKGMLFVGCICQQ